MIDGQIAFVPLTTERKCSQVTWVTGLKPSTTTLAA